MNDWDRLFASDDRSGPALPMRVLRKQGRPLLLVPRNRRAAVRCLDLYPAQTTKARIAKRMLRRFWSAGVFAKTEPTSLPFDPASGFAKYIFSIAGATPGEAARFGILAGNPARGTQRFMVLVFDGASRPVAVVKAGLSAGARALVRAESDFLMQAPKTLRGMPRLISKFECDSLDAFATDFWSGDSPKRGGAGQIFEILSSWLEAGERRALECFPELVMARKALGRESEASMAREISTCVQHGDFAPWNIKVSSQGTWTVLDWERGKLHGIPGWDWFHYEVQTGILVAKRGTSELIERIKRLVSSDLFKKYAEQSGIVGLEKEVLVAYLLFLVEVIKPAEGLSRSRALLEAVRGHTF